MVRNQIHAHLIEANRCFADTKYYEIIKTAWAQWNNERSSTTIQETLSKLPSDQQLVSQLIEQLKGKSIYKNLKRLGKHKNSVQEAKALSSLLTHAIISVEQGQKEYRKLFPLLLTKINEKVYEMIK